MYVLLVLGLALLPAAPANAQVTIFNDSSGNSGTIVDLGSNIRSYSDSNGTTGSIVNLGNGIQSYNFSNPNGNVTNGTLLELGFSNPSVRGNRDPVVPIVPIAPLAPGFPMQPVLPGLQQPRSFGPSDSHQFGR
jgi:hypothetical protein